ncbi:hypothetical protein CLOSTMETH_00147 [[Clostridium] methylpentosum DSM 5476]|uniref:Uncharacterized protein n=1 Tax=[Clostridium] methylpentosum DSM 5476 TaxID=537013 RepID=C0E8K2_9FIRM|nr:hypothetical protein CLOSTMETH_00147 [[Clostridium] methylpentosum DSM 5476]
MTEIHLRSQFWIKMLGNSVVKQSKAHLPTERAAQQSVCILGCKQLKSLPIGFV